MITFKLVLMALQMIYAVSFYNLVLKSSKINCLSAASFYTRPLKLQIIMNL